MTVVIIGAGAAGLTAAYTLQRAGVTDYTILEASNRYGGRLEKLEGFTNFPIDLGGEWLQTDPSVFAQITQEATAIETVPNEPKYFEWDGESFTEYDIGTRDRKFVNFTWYDFFDDFVAPTVLNSIVYDCQVDTIDWSNATVSTKCGNRTFTSAQVILTVPITVLQDEDINFVPGLPSDYVSALAKPIMPNGIKMFLKFREQFYAPDTSFALESDLTGNQWEESTRFFYDETYGQTSSDNILGVVALGEPADKTKDWDDARLIAQALSDLDGIYDGKATANFMEAKVKNWASEPYIRGCYSFYRDKYRAIDVLREPLGRRIFLAGEAIPIKSSDYAHGFAHGAALSGQFAAKDIMTPSGTVPTQNLTCASVVSLVLLSIFLCTW